MPKYLIERELPGAGRLSADELQRIAAKSCEVLQALGPQIQWVHSYVTENAINCIYVAPDEELIRQHAARGGFPVTRISRVNSILEPTSAETPARL